MKENYFSKIKYFNLYSFILLAERQESHFEVGLAFRININFCILIVGTVHNLLSWYLKWEFECVCVGGAHTCMIIFQLSFEMIIIFISD